MVAANPKNAHLVVASCVCRSLCSGSTALKNADLEVGTCTFKKVCRSAMLVSVSFAMETFENADFENAENAMLDAKM